MTWKSLFRIKREHCEINIELQHPILLLFVAISLIWYVVNPSAVPAILFWGLLAILLGSYGWVRVNARFVDAKRRLLSRVVQVGDELEEVIELVNRSWVPVIWAEFKDRSELPGYTVNSVRAIGGLTAMSWNAKAICERRGVYHLGPWKLLLADPLGIFQLCFEYQDVMEVVVFPQIAFLPFDLFMNKDQSGDVSRLNRIQLAETVFAYSVRNYQPGDALRRIHWRTSARRGELFVKSFEPEAIQKVWLVMDLNINAHLLNGARIDENTLEYMAMVTASVARDLLQRNIKVGLLAGGENLTIVRPSNNPMQHFTILEAIARMEANSVEFKDVVSESIRICEGQSLKVFITPSDNTHWLQAFSEYKTGAKPVSAAVILIDKYSFYSKKQAENRASIHEVRAALASRGMMCRVTGKGEVKPLAGFYGPLRRWEFKTTGFGRAIAQRRPEELSEAGKNG